MSEVSVSIRGLFVVHMLTNHISVGSSCMQVYSPCGEYGGKQWLGGVGISITPLTQTNPTNNERRTEEEAWISVIWKHQNIGR